MKTITLDTQILDLVGRTVSPEVVRSLKNTLKRAVRVERTMLAEADEKSPRDTLSFADPEVLDQLITACHQDLGEEDTLRLVLDIADVFKSCGDLKHAERLYAMAIRQSASSSLPAIEGEAYLRRGETFARQSRWHEAISDLRRSRQMFDRADNAQAVGRIDNILGTIAVEQGNMRKARELFKRALNAFKRSQQSAMMGKVLMNLGIVQNILGRYDDALDAYEQARPFFEEADDQVRLASLLHNIGMSHLSRGSFSNALASFERAHALGSRLGNVDIQGLATLCKANVYFKQRDLKRALRSANRSMDQFVMVNDRLSVADAYKLKGMIYREMKRFDLAESYLKTSLRLNRELESQLNTGEAYFEVALLEKQRGNKAEALEALEKARACFMKVGARTEMLRTLELMGQIKEA